MSLVDGTLDTRIDDTLDTGRRTLTARQYRAFRIDVGPTTRVVLEFAISSATVQDWSVRIALLKEVGGALEIVRWPDNRTWASLIRHPLRIAIVGSAQAYTDEKPAVVFDGYDGPWEIWLWSVQGADNEFHLELVEALGV